MMLKQGTEAFDWACRKHGGPQPQPRRENDAQREEQTTPGSRNPDGINRTPGGGRQTETCPAAQCRAGMVAAEQDRKCLKQVCMQQPGIRACTCSASARQKLEGLGSGRLPGSCGLNDQLRAQIERLGPHRLGQWGDYVLFTAAYWAPAWARDSVTDKSSKSSAAGVPDKDGKKMSAGRRWARRAPLWEQKAALLDFWLQAGTVRPGGQEIAKRIVPLRALPSGGACAGMKGKPVHNPIAFGTPAICWRVRHT